MHPSSMGAPQLPDFGEDSMDINKFVEVLEERHRASDSGQDNKQLEVNKTSF
jgi:hypothetical protein